MPAQPKLPEVNEFVLATVKKILPFGAVCSLEEYGNAEAFAHISEVSSGWVRNIREHLKDGQKVVAKVVFVDAGKHQIDLSFKRISESERKRKLELVQSEKRGMKLLERAGIRMGKSLPQSLTEVGNALALEFGSLYDAFEAIAGGIESKTKLSKQWLAALKSVAEQEIKVKKIAIRSTISLKSYAPDGVEKVKRVLRDAGVIAQEGVFCTVHYVSAPHYFFDVTAADYKTGEKFLQKALAAVEAKAKKEGVVYSLDNK